MKPPPVVVVEPVPSETILPPLPPPAHNPAVVVYSTFDPPLESINSTSDDEHVIMRLNVAADKPSVEQPHPQSPSHIDNSSAPFSGAPGAYDSSECAFAPTPTCTWTSDTAAAIVATAKHDALPSACNASALRCDACEHHPQTDSYNIPVSTSALQQPDVASHNGTALRRAKVLVEFEKKCLVGEWPSTTSVHCYWCCHGFNGAPVGIPVKFVHDKFHVFGCFCSLECAASYNFAHTGSVDESLERHALLNTMAWRMGYTRGAVRQAPDRLTLRMFGGPLSIEDFRASCASSRFTLVHFPPMQCVTQQLEEVYDGDMRSAYRFIPLDNERVTKYQEKLKLRRSKPLASFNNTLDQTMSLKYTSHVPALC